MNDYRNVPVYMNGDNIYELVYFEEKRAWYIRCSMRSTGEQTWSTTSYDTPREGMLGFDGKITYTSEAPGQP